MNDGTKKPRRQRVDSPAGVAAAIVSGGKKITLPAGTVFDAKERGVFAELADEFSKSELSPHKIRLLAILAKQIVMLDREQVALTREGVVLVNSHGNAFPNPRVKVCSGLTSSILSMRRSLGIHTRVQAGGDNRDSAKRRAINKANEAARDNYEDNLIAFPPPLPQEEPDDD